MIEYIGGSFGEITERSDTMKKLTEVFETGQSVKAAHFGSVQELEAKKKEKTLEDKLKELENKVKKLEPIATERVFIPSAQEIINFGSLAR